MSRPTGRPTKYSLELAEEICREIASCSKGLNVLCNEKDHWPDWSTVRAWIREKEVFSHMYARAKLDQADLLAEETLNIADNINNDTYINEDGKEVCNHEWINRSRLRVDTRKWLAAKLAPRIYGEKVQHDASISVRQEDAIKDLE